MYALLEKLYNKIDNDLNNSIEEDVIYKIVEECFWRTRHLGMDFNSLLREDILITINNETNEIDIRQNELFGIFWSFDINTGELVGT